MFIILWGLIACVSAVANQVSAAPESVQLDSTISPITQPASKNVRNASSFPGADLGAKINAADKDLGTRIGDILVRDGGTISTQVIISPGHTLRFGAGTYRLTTELLWQGAFLLKSRTSVVGSGWTTVIVEPPKTGWMVFQSFEDAHSQPVHSGVSSDINITNLQIKGANPAVEGSVRQTIGLSNCHRCRVEHVWLDQTGVIGVQAGGNALAGNFADDVVIKDNLFTHVAGQAVAVVNGRNIVISGNTFRDSGRRAQQGMTPIDVEPNDPSDTAQHIEITNNVIDSRGSTFLHGNGILVQNAVGTPNFGPVLVSNNKITGGELMPTVGGRIATGIYIADKTKDVTVANNTITRVVHSGIRLQNTRHDYVSGNKLISTGTGGILAFEVTDTTDSTIVDNVVAIDPNSPAATSVIKESGGSRNNTYRGNTDGRNRLDPILARGSSAPNR